MSAPGVAWGRTDSRAQMMNDDGEPVTTDPTAALLYGTSTKGRPIGGRYRVERLLGSGSAGFVVSARHVILQRRVTLKILHATRGARQRAQRRHLALAHVAAGLRSDHVARVVDTGFADDGAPFVATEYLEGRTLADELAARGRLPPHEAVGWILQACAGIAEAHAAGIVHGDLKPRNLFLAEAGDGRRSGRVLKILDFGMISPMDGAAEDAITPWLGSPAYVAPEQIEGTPGRAGPASDLWSLGVILHELLTGSLPFAADTVAGTLVAIAYDDPPLAAAPDVSLELAKVVHACLAKDPAARPRDAATLAQLLAPFAGRPGAALARKVTESAQLGAESGHTSVSAMTIDSDPAAPTDDAPPPPPPAATGVLAGLRDRRERPTAHPMGSNLAFRLLERQQKIERRRRGALLVVGAASILAFAGIMANPTPSRPSAASSDAIGTTTLTQASLLGASMTDPGASLSTETQLTLDSGLPDSPMVDLPAPPPSEAPASDRMTLPPPLPPRESAPSGNKVRTSLIVREDPYAKGFTHPTRLGNHAK